MEHKGMGLRERKKLRTRRTLIETGLRLFEAKGFEATTVADICAAAEISPATFFTYFPAKEDLVFADQPDQVEAVNELLAGRRPGESVREVLTRVVEQFTAAGAWSIDPDDPLVAVRARLIATVPALRAVALRRLFDIQGQWAESLAAAFPGELDDLEAHAVIGSVTGAVIAAAMANLRRGEAARPMPEVVTRAAVTAMDALP
ncbi:TetR family transcriptional regulator [Nonomuraea diastatica]|nr:TetR family transcriptional regulator [Nonomuraea diastatica]